MIDKKFLETFCEDPYKKADEIVGWFLDKFGDGEDAYRKYVYRFYDLRNIAITNEEISGEVKNKNKTIYYGIYIIMDYIATYGGGLHIDNRHIYCYNGSYWQVMEDSKIVEVLIQVLSRTNINTTIWSMQKIDEKIYETAIIYPFSDTTKNKINTRNAILIIDPETGEIETHLKLCKFFFTYELPCNYQKKPIESVYFKQFLERALSQESIEILQKFLGSCFLIKSKYRIEKALYIYGRGGTGKSTLMNCISYVLGGSNNVSSASIEQLTSNETVIKSVYKKLLNISSETSFRNVNIEMLKKMISNEPIEFRGAYDRKTTITDTFPRIIMVSNHLPSSFENDNSLQRRFIFISMDKQIDNIDITLEHKILTHDCDFILQWILEGVKKVIQEGISTSHESLEIMKNIEDNNSFNIFFSEEFPNIISSYDKITATDLYNKYADFCKINNMQPKSRQKFINEAKNLGLEKKSIRVDGKVLMGYDLSKATISNS